MNRIPEGQQFSVHEPVLWRVLGVLARRGYPVPPDEGRDLIHDFYLDAWGGLLQRFDERLSAFSTYVAAAFYRFARRRVVELQSIRVRLVDLELALEEASDAPNPADLTETGQAMARVREALGRLPAPSRQLLVDFADAPSRGERQLAARHGMTRHAARKQLADAIGRLASELVALQPADALEARIAAELWSEGRSVRAVSERLGLSATQVQSQRRRIAARLLTALREQDRPRHRTPQGATK